MDYCRCGPAAGNTRFPECGSPTRSRREGLDVSARAQKHLENRSSTPSRCWTQQGSTPSLHSPPCARNDLHVTRPPQTLPSWSSCTTRLHVQSERQNTLRVLHSERAMAYSFPSYWIISIQHTGLSVGLRRREWLSSADRTAWPVSSHPYDSVSH